MAVEGQPKTLTCLFDTTAKLPYLFYYKHLANVNTMFMLRRDMFSPGETATGFKERFHARLKVTAKLVPLTIQRVQLSDSVVYYCALRPTVTTGYTAPLQKLVLKMEKSISVLIILIMATGMVSGDSLTPDKEEYTPTEGSSVTLSCTYETSSDYIYLYWYRHYSNQAPQFLLWKGARSLSSSEHIPDKRYTSKTSQKSTELVITSLTLADTALYYCALDTVIQSCRAEDNVTQPTEDVMAVEGQPTTVTCLFDTTDQSPYLFWYKQQTNSNPMFMLRRDTFSPGDSATEFKERFDARLNVTAKSVPLTIQRLQLSDSAVYYCALRPTLTTGNTAPLQKLFACRGDNVQQQPGGVIATEGGLVTLSCKYSTTNTAAGFKERFDASLNGKKQSVPLMIWRVQLSDSALCYCALQPTVTGNLCTLYKNLERKLTSPRHPLIFCDSNGQTIEPIREEVYAPAGSNITLSCTYSSAVSLQWYLQDPGSAPQYILLILHDVGSPSRAPGLDPRLSVKLNDEKTRVDLEISSAKEKDSAMYYCGLTPTVKGNLHTLYKNLT
ncbi:unnamed protein product [Coregonus sp. 'balchen']|nr:unnamed protein product [Coregonus sp. 'balchen']